MFLQRWSSRAVLIGTAVLMMTIPRLSWALQTVQVGPSGAIVFSAPQANATMAGTLRPGQTVRISDAPTSGYYRVAVGRAYVGWVQESALGMGGGGASPSAPSAPVATTARSSAPEPRREQPKSYLGAFGGLGISTDRGTSFSFGFDGGYKLNNLWSLGLYFEYIPLAAPKPGSSATASSSLAAASSKVSLVIAALEVNYSILRVPGLYVGAKGGLGMAVGNTTSTATSTTSGADTSGLGPVTNPTANTTSFVAGGGVAVGYDYPVWQQQMTVGGEASLFFVTGDLAATLVNVMASVHYTF